MVQPLFSTEQDKLANIEQLLEHFEQLESQFQAVRESLTHSHRLTTLGTLSSVVAHELNNILTPVMSYAELALMKPGDEAMNRKALEKAISGCTKAAKISQGLLGFSHDDDDLTVASLQQALEDTLACMARDPAKDGIALTIEVPDVQICMSPVKLQQVLLNLFLNASKVMRETGGSLAIQGTEQGSWLQLSIADTGPGIPLEIQDTLFEPFVTRQVEPVPGSVSKGSLSSFGSSRGTGLGLCICRDLVQNVGGDINFQTEQGKGTTFQLSLPIVEDSYETT